MSSDLSGNVLSALEAFGAEYSNSAAATGAPERPPNGDWDCLLNSVEAEVGNDITMKIGDVEIPALKVSFGWKLIGGSSAVPPTMKAGQVWPGRSFILPAGGMGALPSSTTNGKRQNLEIQLKRLKGHLSVILGPKATNNFMLDLKAVVALAGNPDNATAIKVGCVHSKGDGDATYFEEFAKRNLTSPS